MTTVTTSSARHVLFRLEDGQRLPDALLATLRDEVVMAGWLRASGVLSEVKLRTPGSNTVRSLQGTMHLLVLDGSVGLADGDVTCGLRAVLARETDRGLETIAGEIVGARIGALEVMVTALDEVTANRRPGPDGVWLLDPAGATPSPRPVASPPAPPAVVSPPAAASSPVASASEPDLPKAAPSAPANPRPSPTFTATAMPARPVKPVVVEEEQIAPDAGDVVEHFAFGRCDVVKSDGDRLHLRLGKDGRIKEIALEMLKVTPLAPVEGVAGRHFRLDRKL